MTIVFIGGAGRSGSTVLEKILGNLAGCFSAGELRFFWQYVSEGGHSCGCGQPLTECAFWQPVIDEISQQGFAIEELAPIAARIDRSRHALWASTLFADDFRKLADATRALYSAVSSHSGASYLIDSSKSPAHFRLLLASGLADVRLIRLVRDGRAVAHAWHQRPKRDPDSTVGGHMPRRDSRYAALVWSWEVLLLAALSRHLTHRTQLRYEDLVDDMGPELSRVVAELELEGLDRADLDRLADAIDLEPTHSVGGNPLRFEPNLRLRPDNRSWERDLRGVNRLLVTLFALPGLLRHGYPLRARK